MGQLNFTQVSLSNNDFNRPGAGAEQWHDQNIANIPTSGVRSKRLDKYFRFSWSMFEKIKDQYDFTKFDQEIRNAINNGQKFGFGIMTHYPQPPSGHRLSYDGGTSVYPEYLHNLMQSESVKDWRASNGTWVPNWNSQHYIDRLLALHKAIDNHIKTTTYNGVAYKNIINYIDVRGYGAYGEWHLYTIADPVTNSPSGTRATLASLKKIIDTHTEGFPDFPLVLLVSTFDANRLNNTKNPPEIAEYALRQSNNWGKFGWRRDNWGATDAYLRQYTDQNNVTVNGMHLATEIMNRWKEAQVNGEPCCSADYNDLVNQVNRYHCLSFGNGNFSNNTTIDANMRNASKAAGYKLTLTGGETSVSNKQLKVKLDWRNIGLTPTYEDWDIVFELKNSNNQIVWSGQSTFKLKLFLPSNSSTSHEDEFDLNSVPNGQYNLSFKVIDKGRFRSPMPLFIQNQQSDGSYSLDSVNLSGVEVPNQNPLVEAGDNITITQPVSSVVLNAVGQDPDGQVVNYLWEKVTGGACFISNPNSQMTTVTGLSTGNYTFKVTVTDNRGATATDTLNVTVNEAVNEIPTAEAGLDEVVKLPVNSVELNGVGSSDIDGTIISYLWTIKAGSPAATISHPTQSVTNVLLTNPGTYEFELTVTDNRGASDKDTVVVTLQAADPEPEPTGSLYEIKDIDGNLLTSFNTDKIFNLSSENVKLVSISKNVNEYLILVSK